MSATLASDGSQQSVQSLHDSASDGDIITIPAGNFTWTGTLTLTKAVTLQGAGMTATTIQNNALNIDMMKVTSGKAGHIILSGFGIQQIAKSQSVYFALSLDRDDSTAYTVIIKDVQFDANGIYNYSISLWANGIIFTGCTFIGTRQPNGGGGLTFTCQKYGTGVEASPYGWNTESTMGALDVTGLRNTYIEDSQFIGAAVTNVDDHARVVIRNCVQEDGQFGTHGQDSSVFGMRHFEIYNCTFRNVNAGALNLQCWMSARGGTFAWHDNQIDEIGGKSTYNFSVQQINRHSGPGGCQTGYPANRQIGRGWSSSSQSTSGTPVVVENGKGEVLDPGYIWGNSGTGSSLDHYWIDQYSPDDCGNGKLSRVTFTGKVTSGSAQITGVSITSNAGFATAPSIANNINVGMGVYDESGTYFDPGTHVTAISGTTLTVSANAKASGTGKTFLTGFITVGHDVIYGTPKPGYTPFEYPHPIASGLPVTPPPDGGGGPPDGGGGPPPDGGGGGETPPPEIGETYFGWLNALAKFIQDNPAVPDKKK